MDSAGDHRIKRDSTSGQLGSIDRHGWLRESGRSRWIVAGSPGVPPATPATAPTLANSGQPTGALLLTGALPEDASNELRAQAQAGRASPPSVPRTTYVLDGGSPDLSKHVGHWVEISGTLTVHPAGTGEAKAPVNHLAVRNVRMLTANCPKATAAEK